MKSRRRFFRVAAGAAAAVAVSPLLEPVAAAAAAAPAPAPGLRVGMLLLNSRTREVVQVAAIGDGYATLTRGIGSLICEMDPDDLMIPLGDPLDGEVRLDGTYGVRAEKPFKLLHGEPNS